MQYLCGKGDNVKKNSQYRIGKALLVFSVLFLFFAGRDNTVAAESTFRWAYQGDIQSLDPHVLNESFTLGFLSNVYEGLVRRDHNLGIEPALAASWEQLEPTRWRFHLRQGVVFHNGNPFTASDVVFTFERALHKDANAKSYIPAGLEIEVVDDFTIDFITATPNPILFHEWPNLLIMDREWSEANGAEIPASVAEGRIGFASAHANGTGAFRLLSRVEGGAAELEVNNQWWDEKKHNLDRVIFTPIGKDATRVAALISGEMDLIYPVPLQDMAAIEALEETRVVAGPEVRTMFLGMDQMRDELLYSNVMGENPLADRRVREAFYRAIDVELLNRKVLYGIGMPAATMISPLLFAPAKDMQRLDYDPEKARNLLKEAGYEKGFELELLCPNDRYLKDEEICLAVAAFLAKIGVTAKVEAIPKSQFFKRLLGQDTSFYFLGWTPGSLDSYNVIQNVIGSPDKELKRGGFNFGGYSNPRIDQLAEKILVEIDQGRRNELITQAYQILAEDVGYIPLHQQGVVWGVRRGIEVRSRADDSLMLYTITKAR